MKYVTASRRARDYTRKRFFIPRTGERLSSLPLASFFPGCKLLGCSLVLAIALLPGLSCAPERSTTDPILIVGIDGFEWGVLAPLVKAGEMPNFAALMESGQYGLMKTMRPTFSPIIWTSIATGKTARDHGIRGFVKRRDRGAGEKKRLYNSLDRRTKAFWNILSDYGRSSAVVGWWMTFPAEPIEGVMVAQVNTLDQARRSQGQTILKGGLHSDVEGQVFPEERAAEVLGIHDRVVEELPERVRAIFGDEPVPTSPLTERLWENTQWAFRADAVYLEVAERLAREGHDLVACYLGGADVTGHRFWRHMRPDLYDNPPPQEEIDAFGDVVPDYYRFLDQALGRLVQAMPENTNIMVITDHGMSAINRDAVFSSQDLPEDVNSAHHHGAKAGVVIVSGPGFSRAETLGQSWKKKDLPTLASIFDVAPTLLSLLSVPVGDDMVGEVMAAVSTPATRSVPTHDSEEWLERRQEERGEEVSEDPERMKQLRALGYID